MPKKGKQYRQMAEKVDRDKLYALNEAVALVKQTSPTKFDGTIELHVRTGIDPKKPEQAIRDTLTLPHGNGKEGKLKIAAIVPDEKVKVAKDAGANAAGLEDMIAELSKGKINYDIILATPDVMKKIGKLAKILGQKGLMPNPKSGTVDQDVEKMVKAIRSGRVEFRNDKEGNLHVAVGKVSFDEDKLLNNIQALLKAIRDTKPSSMKGTYLLSATLASTMGPGVKVDLNEAMKAL